LISLKTSHAAYCVVLLCLLAGMTIHAQNAGSALAAPTDLENPPRSFRAYTLGMSMDEVQDALKADSLFFYRGEVDVSLLPRPNETLLEVSGLDFIRRAFFQFHEDRLFVMIFSMNERKIDHYSIFTTMAGKYGRPTSLTPAESIWLGEQTRVAIERPLAVKYIDMTIFNQLKEAGEALESWENLLRQDFLSDF